MICLGKGDTMRKYDLYWRSNPEWWDIKEGIPVIREDAPKEAQESYHNYLSQKNINYERSPSELRE